MPSQEIFAEADALARAGDDSEFLAELMESFFAERRGYEAKLTDLLAAADTVGLGERAHTLRGLLANLGARRAASTAHSLELHASGGWLQECAMLLEQLHSDIDELHTVWEALQR